MVFFRTDLQINKPVNVVVLDENHKIWSKDPMNKVIYI